MQFTRIGRALAVVVVVGSGGALARSTQIQWEASWEHEGVRIETASIEAPMDPGKPYGDKVNIQLGRIRGEDADAGEDNAARSVLYNPGGPGEPGVDNLVKYGAALKKLIGPKFHIVTFDARGTSPKQPLDCFDDPGQLATLLAQVSQPTGGEADGGLDLGLLSAMRAARSIAAGCRGGRAEGKGMPLEYVSTPLVAADVMAVVDALGEDGQLRFWGTSWGGVLGVTIAALYPGRVDKMILDSSVDVTDYYRTPWNVPSLETQDAAFWAVMRECWNAGAGACPLVQPVPRAEGVGEGFGAFKARVLAAIVSARKTSTTTLLPTKHRQQQQACDIDAALNIGLFYPQTRPLLAEMLARLVALGPRDGWYAELCGAMARAPTAMGEGLTSLSRVPRNLAYRCNDGAGRWAPAKTLAQAREVRQRRVDAGRAMGGQSMMMVNLVCGAWETEAVEFSGGPGGEKMGGDDGFDGDFSGAKIETTGGGGSPALIVHFTRDPKMAMSAAEALEETFVGSRLVRLDGEGHGLPGAQNIPESVVKVVQDYLAQGELPAAGTSITIASPAAFVAARLGRVMKLLRYVNIFRGVEV